MLYELALAWFALCDQLPPALVIPAVFAPFWFPALVAVGLGTWLEYHK